MSLHPTLKESDYWDFAQEMADLVADYSRDVMLLTLTTEEIHNLGHSIYTELCRAKNDRD